MPFATPTWWRSAGPDGPTDADDARAAGNRLLLASLGGQLGAWLFGGAIAAMFLVDAATKELKPGIWPIVAQFPPMWAALLAAVVLGTKRGGLAIFGHGPLLRLRDARWLAVGVATQVALVPLYMLLQADKKDVAKPAEELFDRTGGRLGPLLLLGLAVGIGAPIVEELFYRGVIWRGFALLRRGRDGLLSTVGPVVASGVIFGAIHLQPLQFPGLAIVGAVCAFAASREGRLAPAIAVHMGFNLLTVVTLAIR